MDEVQELTSAECDEDTSILDSSLEKTNGPELKSSFHDYVKEEGHLGDQELSSSSLEVEPDDDFTSIAPSCSEADASPNRTAQQSDGEDAVSERTPSQEGTKPPRALLSNLRLVFLVYTPKFLQRGFTPDHAGDKAQVTEDPIEEDVPMANDTPRKGHTQVSASDLLFPRKTIEPDLEFDEEPNSESDEKPEDMEPGEPSSYWSGSRGG